MKCVILHDRIASDARPDEQDALVQVAAVSEALLELGHNPTPVSLDSTLTETIDALRGMRPDFAFNLVESVNGEGKYIHQAPALLEILGMPYTGASAQAMLLSSNKLLAKRILAGAEIATPPWFAEGECFGTARFVNGRHIIKPVWEHASIGMDDGAIVLPPAQPELLARMRAFQKRTGVACFAERYIEGREFNISLLEGEGGIEVLPPAEIDFSLFPPGKPRVVGYAAKWEPDSFEYNHTPRRFQFPDSDAPLLGHLKSLAIRCWRCLGLRGYARVDMRVDKNDVPWVLEINANPCLSPDAGFAAALETAGIPFQTAIERIVRASVPRAHPTRERTAATA